MGLFKNGDEMDKKYYVVILISLVWIGLRTEAYFKIDKNQDLSAVPTGQAGFGAISGLVFADNRGYQRGVKIHLIKEGTQEYQSYLASYSGSFKIYDVQKGAYKLNFTKHGFETEEKTIWVNKGELTKLSPIILNRKPNLHYLEYFYHFVNVLNITATVFLLTIGIGTYVNYGLKIPTITGGVQIDVILHPKPN